MLSVVTEAKYQRTHRHWQQPHISKMALRPRRRRLQGRGQNKRAGSVVPQQGAMYDVLSQLQVAQSP